MNAATLQAWWSHRQGLDGSLAGAAPEAVLERAGWARSVGGCGPYLALHGRAGISRQEADAAASALQIQELPAARGCTYVVPAPDFALALVCARGHAEVAEMRTARGLGVTDEEIERLCQGVLAALEAGPLEPRGLATAVGELTRALGPEGVKKGLSTTLPVALSQLQVSGEIRRIPADGRLDQQRYRYALWRPNPLAECRLSREEAMAELARRFFRWIGPATLAEFRAFSGLGVNAAKAAAAPLGLVPLAEGDERLMLPEDFEALAAFRAPAEPRYALVSSLDTISLLRRDVRALLAEEDLDRPVATGKSLAHLGALGELPCHPIMDRGRVVGLWEFDPAAGEVLWLPFVEVTEDLRAAVRRAEAFVGEELGDARSFSLDSPKSRAPRLAWLREMQ